MTNENQLEKDMKATADLIVNKFTDITESVRMYKNIIANNPEQFENQKYQVYSLLVRLGCTDKEIRQINYFKGYNPEE